MPGQHSLFQWEWVRLAQAASCLLLAEHFARFHDSVSRSQVSCPEPTDCRTENGVLLFNGPLQEQNQTGVEYTDYLLIGLKDGSLVMELQLGASVTRLQLPEFVADGRFHKVKVVALTNPVTFGRRSHSLNMAAALSWCSTTASTSPGRRYARASAAWTPFSVKATDV